jgi:hypothetical protein
MKNEQNLIYYGDVYFWKDGSTKPQKIQVIMDTGSSWLWAPSTVCKGCPSDDTVDHSFFVNKGDGVKAVKYGSGSISGDIVRGKVSLSPDVSHAVSNYKMLEVTQASMPGLENSKWDGILGLLPTAISGSDLYVTELFKQGIVSEDAFGVYYTDTKNQSEITFGGFDKSRVKERDDFTFLPLYDEFHWAVELKRIKYGPFKELNISVSNAILDSGTSLVILPTSMFDNFKQVVSEGRKCGTLRVYYGCLCQSKYDFDPMYFWLADYEYRMDQEHYIVETISNRQKFCYFLVQGNDFKKTSIILGDAFLRGYYVFHDVTNREVGMFGDYMLYYGPKIKYLWIKIGLACAFVFVFLTTVCCLYYC